MRLIAALAGIALATTGCIGFSSAGSSGPSSDRDLAVPWPKTMVTITYTVDTCPPGAHCIVARGGSGYTQAQRRLDCSPAGGSGYPDPAEACRALTDIVTKQHQQQSQTGPICGCLMTRDAPKAVGYYDGKRRTIRLDGCSLCGLGGIGADLKILLPGAAA
jgi:hypothetical protein